MKKYIAEFIGTFWLVLGGCGSAVFAANFGGDTNPLGIAFVGVSLAFGLTVLTGAALFAGNIEIIGQLWLFWVAPILGAVLAGFLYYQYFEEV